jgi:hypothetical protein
MSFPVSLPYSLPHVLLPFLRSRAFLPVLCSTHSLMPIFPNLAQQSVGTRGRAPAHERTSSCTRLHLPGLSFASLASSFAIPDSILSDHSISMPFITCSTHSLIPDSSSRQQAIPSFLSFAHVLPSAPLKLFLYHPLSYIPPLSTLLFQFSP